MKTSYILIAVVLAVIVIGGVFVLQSNNSSQVPSLGEEENVMPPIVEEQPQPSLVVTYGDEGYSPKELIVKKGETVTFTNESSQPMWTASAIHPSHMAYPGTDVKDCGSTTMGMMFDACTGVLTGGTWMFQLNEVGSWGYHNHLRPTHTGKIIVE